MQELGHMGDQHIMLMNQVVLIPPSLVNEIRSMVCVLKISFGRYYTTRPCGGIQHIQIHGCGFEVHSIEVHARMNSYHEMKEDLVLYGIYVTVVTFVLTHSYD